MKAGAPLLVADVGGTHLRLALADADGRLRNHEATATPDHGLAEALRGYVQRQGASPRTCLLGIAGPVRDAAGPTATPLTNRALVVDARALSRELGCPVLLHNDVAAMAAALPVLDATALDPMGGPSPTATAARCVVALGTGFGAALLTAGGETVPGEAGHAPLPGPALRSARLRDEFSSVESLLSGPGWARLTGLVADRAAAMEIFTDALSCVCASIALTTGAWGGVHLAGGLFAALAPGIDPRRLRAGLTSRGAMAAALADLPLVAVRDDHVALRGLARLGAGAG